MQYFERTIKNHINKLFLRKDSLVIVIYGPRQAGKTTLIKDLVKEKVSETLFVNGDSREAQSQFSINSLGHLKKIVGNKKILVIDEAQKIDNIGLSLKLLVDNLEIKILVSGSASFDLANRMNEPLTGRSLTYFMYPLSVEEIGLEKNWHLEKENLLNQVLRFGSFPKTFNLAGQEDIIEYLQNYLDNYLYRDILAFDFIKKPKKVLDLLTMLALQIGNEVSVNELSTALAVSRPTIEKYLDVLEKLFVLYNLRGFSRNLRKEINKTSKYYFYDLGLRNALIRNFNSLNLRNDTGQMFENFFILEKIKMANNLLKPANFYFWRTYDQKEIDLIQESEGQLTAYEVKWQLSSVKLPIDFKNNYPEATFNPISPQNFLEHLGIK